MSARRLLCVAACMAVAFAHAASPEEPRTFAIVSAMGNVFTAVNEINQTGTHLAPYRKRTFEVKDDTINKLVLKGLGEAVAETQPEAKRIFLSVRLPPEIQDRPTRIDSAAFDEALEELRRMPQRGQWYRIVLATPAYRSGDSGDGLWAGMQGMGLFTQPLCHDLKDCDATTQPMTAGPKARTPSGETVTTSRYVAPYLFAKIWILDPRTLEVLDTQEIFDHEKLYDPNSGSVDQNQNIEPKVLAAKILERVEVSTAEAVRRSELRGHVDVQEKGPVVPPR